MMLEEYELDQLNVYRDCIQAISYKPNWQIRIMTDVDQIILTKMVHIRIGIYNVPNSETNALVDLLTESLFLPLSAPKQEIVRKIYEEILRIELHEAAEFFKYKHKAIYHPHLNEHMTNEH